MASRIKQHTLTVWIDMEKAYDRVWKDGLRLKLQKSGVTGCIYQWISQYLTNRKARVHVNGTYSRKKTLKEGVPQGGVLSPTLFLVFINDIVGDMPRKVQGAIYADDLVLWCSEEHLSTANYRMQQALNTLEGWTNRWLEKINSRKTTYTIFSLSTNEQKATLHINGQTLLAEDNPTYLGVTFDKRLTWKQQTEKAEARAKVRLAVMKKLAGTTWGADTVTLKRLYTGRVRPVLEYGMTAWGTTAKSNFDRVSKVQNQATRIITGAMKSTPIMELETITGLQSLDDRRDLKLLRQAAKFKRLQDHPMRQRLSQPTKGRLKRESFVHQSRVLERRQEDILDHDPKEIPPPPPHVLRFLPGVGELLLSFGVPSQVLVRKTPKAALRESPSLRNTLKLTTQKSPGPSGTLMALLRMQFGMEGQESTSSTQEAKKTKLAPLPAYTPQTTKLKQKP